MSNTTYYAISALATAIAALFALPHTSHFTQPPAVIAAILISTGVLLCFDRTLKLR